MLTSLPAASVTTRYHVEVGGNGTEKELQHSGITSGVTLPFGLEISLNWPMIGAIIDANRAKAADNPLSQCPSLACQK
jgi:hypothetical protein